MTDKNQKDTLCFLAWLCFAIWVAVFFFNASVEDPKYMTGGVIGVLTIGQLLLASYYTKAIMEKEHILIADTSAYDEVELLVSIRSLPQNRLADAFRERVIDTLVQRIIRNPDCLGAASKMDLILSQDGFIWSSKISVILEGVKIEELTGEQIVNFLKRSGGIMSNKFLMQKFHVALFQELLRQEMGNKCRLTADDLIVLEKLESRFSGADLRCLLLRLDIGVRKEVAGEIAKGPVTPAPPPVPTSVCYYR